MLMNINAEKKLFEQKRNLRKIKMEINNLMT